MTPEGAGQAEWVAIALLGKTRGNRGEITAIPLTSRPERYQELDEVYLFGEGRPYRVQNTWFHGSTLIFKFHGVDTISDAEALAGSEVRIPRSQRLQLEPGEYYQSDLVGCTVVASGTGKAIGVVTAFDESGGAGLLVVGRDLLIPFARSICLEIDTAARRIVVDLPEGLEELNAS